MGGGGLRARSTYLLRQNIVEVGMYAVCDIHSQRRLAGKGRFLSTGHTQCSDGGSGAVVWGGAGEKV